jgi:hypothetical protein
MGDNLWQVGRMLQKPRQEMIKVKNGEAIFGSLEEM